MNKLVDSMRSKLIVALAQVASKMGDIEGNLSSVFEYVEKAKAAKADVVVFPELATSGYLSQGIFLETAEREATHLGRLMKASREICVVLGIVEETDYGMLYNSAMVLGHGNVVVGETTGLKQRCYRKCYLPTYGMFEEHKWFASGERIPIFVLDVPDIGRVKCGVVICEDFWHPLPVASTCMRGAQFVCAISSSPKTLRKPRMVDSLIMTRAIENCVYVVFVNSAGSEDMVNFWGGSKIVSAEGEVVVAAKEMEEDFVVGEIDLYKLKKLRQINPMLRDERREVIEDYLSAYEEMRRV